MVKMATSIEETRYRELLQELVDNLTGDEVSELVFLLRLHIKGKKRRSDIASDATILMTELEKLNCIGINNLTLLVELFELINRTDLKNKIFTILGHSYHVSEPKINRFMRILWKFGQKLDSNDLKNAKFILDLTRDKENIENVWQLFEKAFERGYVVENDINSVEMFANRIKQGERLKAVISIPGFTSIKSSSQENNLNIGDFITPWKEVKRPQPENNLPHFSPSFGIDPLQSTTRNQYFQQPSVLHEDDMSIPPSVAFRNSDLTRELPVSSVGAVTEPFDFTMELLEKLPIQDASARLGNATHFKDVNEQIASLNLLEPQNIPDEIKEEVKSQTEGKHAREMGVIGSSSDNAHLSSIQPTPSGTHISGEIGIHLITSEDLLTKRENETSKDIHTGGAYDEAIPITKMANTYKQDEQLTEELMEKTESRKLRGTLQNVNNVKPNFEQAPKRGEYKKANQELIKSSGRDEKQMSELNISGPNPYLPDEENESIQNEGQYIRDIANLGSFVGVTSQPVNSRQNKADPGIKMDLTKDRRDIREISDKSQSPSVEDLTLRQSAQTEVVGGLFDAHTPTHTFNLNSRPDGTSPNVENKEEITQIEEMLAKLNLPEKSNANPNESREINMINSEHVDKTLGKDELNETKLPGNINQSTDVVISNSKQDSVVHTSTSEETLHVQNGRERHSSFHKSLVSSSYARTSESEGDAIGTQEAVDGKSLNPKNQEHPNGLHGHSDRGLMERNSVFPTTKKLSVYSLNYPRSGQIITMTIDKMKSHIGDVIGEGSFGIVYKAKVSDEDNLMFAIKEIKTKRELFQKSYDMEIHHGRILHPFINPIVARAESLEEGICYLMYPYMMNCELRQNIDFVNQGKILCPKESNANIWSRCIYQIVQAVDFLHRPVASVRGPIFHRDLTSRNILLDENFNVRIGDFGIAVEAKLNATKVTMTKALGTEGYHPPNMSQENYNASYDVFSVGVVMLEILTGLEAVLLEDPYCLYKKYNCEGGYEYLIQDLDDRSAENNAARWSKIHYRDKFAEISLQAIQSNEMQRKTVDLLQKLEDLRLDSGECYKIPENQGRCVSCCVNPKAKLSTKGQECIGNERTSPCQHFCVHCLMNHHFNPLVCPQHGKTRPPFGDHVYAVFLAGNYIKGEQQCPGGKGPSHKTKSAQMFVDDVQKVVQVLTAKHPFVMGASKKNIRIVKPENPGTEDKMEAKLKQAFEDLNAAIIEAIKNEKLDPKKDRLPNSLFLFYFSGHCSKNKGLYLGSTGETLKASTDWIQEMLNKKLGVDQILVVLDCCHANSQNFTDTHGLNAVDCRKKACIVQLSSCDENETSSGTFEGEGHGSYFTYYFCHGLLGLDSASLEDDTVMFCNECEKYRKDRSAVDINLPCGKYHNQCLSDHVVTCYALKNYIQGHFQQLGSSTSGSECMTQIYSAQGEKGIYLAYYNPFKWHIPIHLRGSEVSHTFSLNSDTDSMDKIRQNIIKHSVEANFSSDVLKFHDTYASTGKDSSCLIAIYPRYSRDRGIELTSLDSIYKARSCNCELEARVRDNVNAISNGPVKWSKINSTLVVNSGLEINDEHLKICQSYIQVMIHSIRNVEQDLRNMKQSSSKKDLKNLITEVLHVLRCICTCNSGSLLEKEKENVLRIYLYEEFSILALEPFKIGNS